MDALLRATRQNLGLLSEQIDEKTCAMLGNLPQALSHLALINAAEAIGRAVGTGPLPSVQTPLHF
jgi:GH15 family glucan-1,4-alpha-glucosidase